MIKIISSALILALGASFSANSNERNIEFSIPGNHYCDGHHGSDLSFTISNLSDVNTNIKLELFKIDGTQLLRAGTTNNGIGSEIIPGQGFSLQARKTTTYHTPFSGENCSDRVYHGKLTVFGNNGRVIASGVISNLQGQNFRSSAPIIINEGRAF
tara:strand:- start:1233 stop:1700 length:468 start_codon:yes stop_codon:yes gene_type:complete